MMDIPETMCEYAEHPAAGGYVPIHPESLKRWAAEIEALRKLVVRKDAALKIAWNWYKIGEHHPESPIRKYMEDALASPPTSQDGC